MHKPQFTGSCVGLAVALGMSFTAMTRAAVLQFDVSTAAGTYAGSVSPGHATGDVPVSDVTWNGISGAGGVAWQGGLQWADGSGAAGVEYQLGVGFSVDWAEAWTQGGSYDQPYVSLAPGGNFYDTALMEDLLYNSNGFGVRIRGLSPGTYKVYVPNAMYGDLNRTWSLGIGVNPGVSQFGDAVQVGPSGALAAWNGAPDTNSNYYMKEIALADGDYLGIISTGVAGPQISGIQIVTVVPEPCALGLLGLALAAMQLRSRDRQLAACMRGRRQVLWVHHQS